MAQVAEGLLAAAFADIEHALDVIEPCFGPALRAEFPINGVLRVEAAREEDNAGTGWQARCEEVVQRKGPVAVLPEMQNPAPRERIFTPPGALRVTKRCSY